MDSTASLTSSADSAGNGTMANNKLMQDYQGNTSFTRWIVLGCFVAALCIVGATIYWPQVQTALLHAFDKLLETATWLFLGGKSPEVVSAFRAKISAMLGQSGQTQAASTDPPPGQ